MILTPLNFRRLDSASLDQITVIFEGFEAQINPEDVVTRVQYLIDCVKFHNFYEERYALLNFMRTKFIFPPRFNLKLKLIDYFCTQPRNFSFSL